MARAQGARPHAAALRPEPRRPVRPPAADRRPGQADPQGGVLPGGRERPAVHHRAGRVRVHGARRVQRDPVRPGLDGQRLAHQRRRRRRADRVDPRLRARLDRRLRLHRRRLGVGVEVLAARLDAHVRAARLVRGVARAQRARRRADGPVAAAHADRVEAGGDALVLRSRSRRIRRSSSSAASPRPRARRSTCPRPTASSSPATTPSTRACAGASSRWPST